MSREAWRRSSDPQPGRAFSAWPVWEGSASLLTLGPGAAGWGPGVRGQESKVAVDPFYWPAFSFPSVTEFWRSNEGDTPRFRCGLLLE